MAISLLEKYSVDEVFAPFQEVVQVEGEGVSQAVVVPKEKLVTIMEHLAQNFSLDYLSDLTAVDRGEKGFEVVYNLFSISKKFELCVKTLTSQSEAEVPTVIPVWPGADWMEREVYDLMGVTFAGHPNMTRLLLPEEFEGHPLRKTFKLQSRA
ncbi:NADH-quinone oxidoreductase subunit C [Heliorestis acidaminivorans]|uniref:NAD(P)H dehydrogenase subunit J n=1 Tax=Heliorestis acidaminivorans TaxID=553427 RepID=A0A6I0FAA3_9FIRM|nr:NADH-quinone oxidoreductase subunit C [Heliorestis acidaminivorans]KAB2954418.1 NADH-quinone oxidoreductase subunit C [Heliorestis acidaminivorans]